MSESAPATTPTWQMPDPVPLPIETERLTIRPVTAGDADAFFPMIDEHRAALGQWLPWPAKDHLSLDQCRSSLARFAELGDPANSATGVPELITLLLIERSTHEIVGGMGLHDIIPSRGQCEIGYWVRPDRHQRGLCTEATAAWLSRLLLPQHKGGFGFRRVLIECDTLNVASAGVPRTLGMRLEGRFKEELPSVQKDGFRDSLSFAVLDHEWNHDLQRARPGIGWDGWPA
jgi:RimJ/RimL family protein N-acetyltransferase